MPGSKRANVALLVAGFAVGQGSLFLAQTLLVARGEIAFIGLYGLCFSYLVLTQYIVDLGGLIVLAREEVEQPDRRARMAAYWSLCWARLALALALAGLALALSHTLFGPFYQAYILAACPGLILFAFNAGGILDGRRRSGLNGLAAAALYVTTAIALIAPVGGGTPSGAMLGAAFSLGLAIQVFGQFLFLRAGGWRLREPRFSWRDSRAIAWRGLLYLGSWTPGQLLYRLQLTVAVVYFGPAGGGAVIYAKQVLNAGLQFLVFIRRAEFPGLVEFMREPRGLPGIFAAQKLSHVAALLGAAGAVALGLAPWFLGLEDFVAAGWLLVAFAPVIVASNFYSNFVQVAFAVGAYGRSSMTGLMLLPFAFSIMVLAAETGSLTLFALSETVVGIAGALLIYVLLFGGRRPGLAR